MPMIGLMFLFQALFAAEDINIASTVNFDSYPSALIATLRTAIPNWICYRNVRAADFAYDERPGTLAKTIPSVARCQ